MIALENIFSHELVQKLGWTLLHFIWQATVIAIIVAVLLRILRGFSANLLYVISCLAMGMIVLLPVVTMQFINVLPSHKEQPEFRIPNTENRSEVAELQPSVINLPSSVVYEPIRREHAGKNYFAAWKQRTVDVLEPVLPHIVTGWLFGVIALSIWHLGGWAQLQKLRKKMVKQVDTSLKDKLNQLSEKLGVNQAVELLESALVQVPTMIGWLRPVILLPAGALTGLNPEQLEAILAHELAHIKRYDYLVNILQTIVEILGFYHPVVWWISHKIRTERENCCDDLAVAVTSDRISYAKALTSMEEIRGRGELAVAASGGNLLSRIRRLIGKDSSEKTFSWIPAVTVVVMLIAIAIPTTLALATKSDSGKSELNTEARVESELEVSKSKLRQLGLAAVMYADEHEGKLPETLDVLKPYLAAEQVRFWVQNNVVYLGKGRSRKEKTLSKIPVAYDKSMFESKQGTNVLFADAHVEFLETERLKELGISKTSVQIEMRLLYVGEEFMDELNRIFSFKPDSHTWLDDLQVTSLFQAIRKVKDAKMLTAPRATVMDNEMAQYFMGQEVPSISGYTEPNNPAEKPEPIIDYKKIGTICELTPHVSPDKRNVLLEFELQISQLIGFEERIYKGQYKEQVPQVETKTIAKSISTPDGKTLFLDGGVMTLYEKKKSTAAENISDSNDMIKEKKRLIILFKPDVLTQEETGAFGSGDVGPQNLDTSMMSRYGQGELPPGFGGGYEAIAPDTSKLQIEVPPVSRLPESWSLNYDDGLTSDGGKRWPANMAENLVSLEVTPRPFDDSDESWKKETFEFDIRSIPSGATMGSISLRPEPEFGEMRRKIFQPDKYMLNYTREWGKPGNNFRMNCGAFLLDLSKPGMYDLQFSPKLGEVEITGSAGGCYAVNFEKIDRGLPVRGFAYINRQKEYTLDGLPPGTYRLSAVTQQQNGNVLVSRAEVTVKSEEKVTVDIAPPLKGDCSLTGSILGRQKTYSIEGPVPYQAQGEWFVLIREPDSGDIVSTFAYEALTMDSLYVVRGDNIKQDTTDRASYKISGIVPGEYTVTVIENPRVSGSVITRQQSKPLILKAGQEAVLDFDLKKNR